VTFYVIGAAIGRAVMAPEARHLEINLDNVSGKRSPPGEIQECKNLHTFYPTAT
jgi:hypothetical protein